MTTKLAKEKGSTGIEVSISAYNHACDPIGAGWLAQSVGPSTPGAAPHCTGSSQSRASQPVPGVSAAISNPSGRLCGAAPGSAPQLVSAAGPGSALRTTPDTLAPPPGPPKLLVGAVARPDPRAKLTPRRLPAPLDRRQPQYKVKDINEADFGRLECDLAGAFELATDCLFSWCLGAAHAACLCLPISPVIHLLPLFWRPAHARSAIPQACHHDPSTAQPPKHPPPTPPPPHPNNDRQRPRCPA
jgi:hypothetical protein